MRQQMRSRVWRLFALSCVTCVVSFVTVPSLYAVAPQLSDLTVTPQTLAVQSGPQSVTVSVLASDADGDLKKVKLKALRKDGTNEKVTLVDDGTGADAVAQDGRFTVEVLLATDKAERVSLTVTAKDEEKTKARLAARVSIIDLAATPVLSELRVDPPILDPDGGDQLVTISVRVEDPNGDLKNVKLDRLDKPGGFTTAEKLGRLLDDGQGADGVADDGLYHLEVTVTPDEAVIPLRVTAKDAIKNKNAQEISLLSRALSTVKADVLQSEFVIVAGTIADVATGEVLGLNAAQPIELSIQGPDRNRVVDGAGRQVSTLTLEQGFVTLYLRDVLPSFEQPARLTLVAESPGFLASSANVTVTRPNLTQFTLDLLRLDPTVMPDGVELVQEGGSADEAGATVDVVTLETPAEPVTQGTTSVVIPLGTRIRDRQGNPVTGALTTTVTYHNAVTPDALDTVPGGLNDIAVGDPVSPDHGYFISGGMAAVEIVNAAGAEVATFDQPIVLTLRVPGTTINPLTNAPVQAGDLIPTWSYDTTTATWTNMGDQPLVADTDGTFAVTLESDHLSYFTAAWPFTTAGSTFADDSPDGCVKSRTLQVEGNDTAAVLNFRIRREGGGYNNTFVNTSFHVRDPETNDPDRLVVPGAPRQKAVMVEAFLENTMIAEVPIADLCNADAGNVMVLVDPQIEATDITVQVHDVCPDDRRVQAPVPSVPVLFRRIDGEGGFISAGVTNGEGTIELPGLKIGETYDIQALDRRTGAFGTRQVTVAEQTNAVLFDFDLPTRCGSDDPLVLSFTLEGNAIELSDATSTERVGVGRLSGNTVTMAGLATPLATDTLGLTLTVALDRGTGTQVGELIIGLDSQDDFRRMVARFSPVALTATATGATVDVSDAQLEVGVTDVTGTTVSSPLPLANEGVLTSDPTGARLTFDSAALNRVLQANILPTVDLGKATVQYTVSFIGMTLRMAAGGDKCPEAATCRDITTLQGTVGQSRTPVGVGNLVLIVVKGGDGAGIVTSDLSGIDCGETCGANFQLGDLVTLSATPDDDVTFVGWGGACSGTGTCTVALTASETITATFVSSSLPTLTVIKNGSGNGIVSSFPPGIDCGDDCRHGYVAGETVLLTATADATSKFVGWSGGGCLGTAPCVVNVLSDETITATFDISDIPSAQSNLIVTTGGNGTGTVVSVPSGINCGTDCAETYSAEANVLLTATPNSGSVFAGWSGGGCSGIGTCLVSMTINQNVTATFTGMTSTPPPSTVQFTLTVAKGGTGNGTITSLPVGIVCGADCTEPYVEGTVVTLAASPDAGSTFAGWSGGGCSGTGTCVVSMTTNLTVTATLNASGPGPLTFGPILKFAEGVGQARQSMIAADLDQDGHLDLVTANIAGVQVMVLYGNGDGTFGTPRFFSPGVGDSPSHVAVGDVNGDGLLDIATANGGFFATGDSASVLLGQPGRLFGAPDVVVTGLDTPRAVALGDVNGDGTLDLVVATSKSDGPKVSVLTGDGTGNFATPVTIQVGQVGAFGLDSMVLDDISQDGNLDLAVTHSVVRLNVLNGDGLGGFAPEATNATNSQTSGGAPTEILVGDLNNDAKRDIVIVNNRHDGGVTVLLSTNPSDVATFARLDVDFVPDVNPWDGAIGDLNGDGNLDLAVANNGNSSVSLLMGDGFGGFTMLPDLLFEAGGSPLIRSVVMGDFNEDGKLDLAAAPDATFIAVLLNTTVFP